MMDTGRSVQDNGATAMRVRRLALLCVAVLGLFALLAAASARAEDPDPAVAKAKELLAAAQQDKMADQVITLMEKPLSQLVESTNPGRGKEVEALLHDQFLPAMREHLPEFMDLAAHVYAQHFSVEELDQLLAFYKSPVGKKLVAEQPAMLTEMTGIAQAWGRNVAGEVLRKMAPEFQKRGLSMPNI